MTIAVHEIIECYAEHEDPRVRANLCNALAALDLSESNSLLMRLAIMDDDQSVNDKALETLENLPQDRLTKLRGGATSSFEASWDKSRVLNWFRGAHLAALASQKPLFSGIGNWWQETGNTRKLNGRLRFISKSGFGIWKRLFNWSNLFSILTALALTMVLLWVTVKNSDSELSGITFVLAIISLVIGALPMAVLCTPPTIPFRRSSAGAIDSFVILTISAFYLFVPIFGTATLVGEPLGGPFYILILFYVVLPLISVRLSLVSPINLPQIWLRIIAAAFVALGALILTYTLLIWLFSMILEPKNSLNDLKAISICLLFSAPLALFIGIFQGRRPDHLHNAPTTSSVTKLISMRWVATAFVAFAFLAAVFLSPGYNLGSFRGLEAITVELPAEGSKLEKTITFSPQQRVELDALEAGSLDFKLFGLVNSQPVDVILYVDREKTDRERTGPEYYKNEKIEKGLKTITAEIYQPEVSSDDLVQHYIHVIRTFGQAYRLSNFWRRPDKPEAAAQLVVFELELEWFPALEANERK